VELHARLVHDPDGKTTHSQPYGQVGQFIVSINRRDLNETMISEAEKYPNVRFHFHHKVLKHVHSGEDDSGQGGAIVVERTSDVFGKDVQQVDGFDLVLACDGAHSVVRRSLMSYPLFQYSQKYIGICGRP